MFIAVPTGVKILNWLATMHGGKLRFTTAMKFSIGLVAMFTIGGLSGVTHAVSPSDLQQTDTYYIVAHFHYVIFGGALLGFFAGVYFWFPKVFGFRLSEAWGSVHFWLILLGMNLTFGPMHILGLQGQPRRTYTYKDGYGLNFWNLVATVGAFVIAASIVALLWNVFSSYRSFKRAGRPQEDADPWDGRSLEWMVPSPVPHHNFDEIPVVTHLDDFWHRKYGEDDEGRPVRIARTEDVVQKGDAHPHLPNPSYFPIMLAFGLPLVAYGLIFHLGIAALGGVVIVAAIYGWGLEPAFDPEAPGHDDAHGDHVGGGDGHDGAAVELPPADADQAPTAPSELEEAPVG
jgi:cytochrome c oxidase subunit 1